VEKLEGNIKGKPKNRLIDITKRRNAMGGPRLYKSGLGQRNVAGCYKNRNKPASSLKYGESFIVADNLLASKNRHSIK
jgi:hypothetical protein